MRRRLTEAAARLAASGGASALSTRRVATEAGTSTMAVYTEFGSMEALVQAVVSEGFDRLEQSLLAVEPSKDPVHDVASQTYAYVTNARENVELYAVMFGIAPLGAYRPVTPDQLKVGRGGTLDRVGAALARTIGDGRLRDPGGSALSFRWWTIVHGYVILESTGYLTKANGIERILAPLLVDFFVGEGDEPARAAKSVRRGLGLG